VEGQLRADATLGTGTEKMPWNRTGRERPRPVVPSGAPSKEMWGAFLAMGSALLLTAGLAIVLASELRLIPGLGHLVQVQGS